MAVGILAAGCSDEGIIEEPALEDALDDASVSLPQALDIAQTAARGIPIQAELDVVLEEDRYEVELVDVDEGDFRQLEIDPRTGEIEETERDDADEDEIDDANAIADAALSLREAVVLAQNEVNGQAYRAQLEDGLYLVELSADGELGDVEISPSDGAVLRTSGFD